MNKRFLFVLAAAGILLGAALPRQRRVLCTGFLPPNNLRIPVGDVRARGITQQTFDAVLDRAEAVYGPIVAARGARLVVFRKWEDPTVNAAAEQVGKDWQLFMYGGLARHRAVTADGFALVACHELGHHLGGYPKKKDEGWPTNEGGSDYYATLKCLRRLLPGAQAPDNADPLAAAACSSAYPIGRERNLCAAGAMAGLSISRLLAELDGTREPSLATPDRSVVKETDDYHPEAQCRLDTYFQGAQCTKSVDEPVSDTSASAGACTSAAGYKVGFRPLCWFKPPVEQAGAATLARSSLPDPEALKRRIEALGLSLSTGR